MIVLGVILLILGILEQPTLTQDLMDFSCSCWR